MVTAAGGRLRRRRAFRLGQALRVAAAGLAALLAMVVTGWLGVNHGPRMVELGLVAIGAAVLAWTRSYGVMIGLALLVALNGIPGFNANPGGVAISHLQDAAGVGLLFGSLYVVASGKVGPRTQLQRSLYVASSLLAAWWLLTWARSAALNGIPATLAAKFARDFLYFAVTVPLLCDVFVTYPKLRRQVLWTVGTGGVVYAVAQVAHTVGHVPLSFILHPQFSAVVQGTARTFSPMNALVRMGFALSCGAVLLATDTRVRRYAVVTVVVFGTAMLTQLTRAAYFGAAVGLLFAAWIWWFRRGPIRFWTRRQLVLVPVLALLLLGATATISSGERHLFSNIATRALAGYSDVNSTSGTVAVRVNVGSQMLTVLGHRWPIGLGFMHPSARYYQALPNGDIRNPDLGVLNALMLMGALGAILVYVPLFLVLRALTRSRPRQRAAAGDEWFRFGATVWLIGAVASSITLVDLFSFPGLELAACLLAIAASVAAGRERQPQAREAAGP